MRKHRRMTGWRMVLGLGLAVFLIVAICPVALAHSDAAALVPGQPIHGELSENGSFAYYQINYPGGEADLQVRVRFDEYDPSFAGQIGFEVYRVDGWTGEGVSGDEPLWELSYNQESSTMLLVQVYNYAPVPAHYTIVATGISMPSEGAPASAAMPSSEAQPQAMSLDLDVSGAIIGQGGGSYALYMLPSMGDGEDVLVTLSFWPDEPSFAGAFGFVVYSPAGDEVAMGTPTGDAGVREAVFAGKVAGNYSVLVYNYAEGESLAYTLTTSR